MSAKVTFVSHTLQVLQIRALWIVLCSATAEALRNHWRLVKNATKSLWLFLVSESLLFSPLFPCIFSPDVDECLLPGVCSHGHCVNLDGTHKCICNHGYQVTSDSKSCEGLQRITQRYWTQLMTAWVVLCLWSSPRSRIMSANHFFFARCWRVCNWYCLPCENLHQHCRFLHLPDLQAWVWTIYWWTEMWR